MDTAYLFVPETFSFEHPKQHWEGATDMAWGIRAEESKGRTESIIIK